MSQIKSWVLTDVERNLWVDSIFLGHDELGIPDCTVSKRTLRGGLRDGVEIIEVNNGKLSFSVLPTRGMGIWRGEFEGIELGWNSPARGPVHPKFVDLQERGGLGWLYGFDELVCRCGLDSNGSPVEDVVLDNNGNESRIDLTLHGRIANLPAHYLEIRADVEKKTVTIVGHVDESALFCPGLRMVSKVSTSPMSNALAIRDEYVNLKGTSSELEILYHTNFGAPLLEGGARILAPVAELAPRDPRAAEGIKNVDTYLPPTPGYIEQVYFYDLHAGDDGRTAVGLRNAAGNAAVVLRFAKSELPHVTQWKNTVAATDGYVTGIEPGTNYPNPKTVERDHGRVIKLGGGESYACGFDLEVLAGAKSVRALEAEIAALQARGKPTVHETPHPKFS